MFCAKCGTENADDDKFCKSCGASLHGDVAPQENVMKEDNVLRIKIKPYFSWGYKILQMLGRALLTLLIVFLFVFGEVEDVYALFVLYPGIAWGIIGIVLVVYAVKLLFEKLQYNKLEYNLYKTKMEYVDGFLAKQDKEIKYKHIRETILRQNIFERMFGIGTIRFVTNASTYQYAGRNAHGNQNASGIVVHCVKNPREVYEEAKKLIDAASEEEE